VGHKRGKVYPVSLLKGSMVMGFKFLKTRFTQMWDAFSSGRTQRLQRKRDPFN